MDVITLSSVVQHGLIARSRIFTVSVLLPDKPGELVRVSQIIAELQGNIIELVHNQFVSLNRNAAVELVITIEAFGPEHKEKQHRHHPRVSGQPRGDGQEELGDSQRQRQGMGGAV